MKNFKYTLIEIVFSILSFVLILVPIITRDETSVYSTFMIGLASVMLVILVIHLINRKNTILLYITAFISFMNKESQKNYYYNCWCNWVFYL